MIVGDEDVLDEVVLAGGHALDALAAAALGAVLGQFGALDVAVARDGHDHLFVRDQVLDVELADAALDDGAAALVGVQVAGLDQLVADDLHEFVTVAQHLEQPLDQSLEFVVFVLDLLALEAGQTLQAHVQDGLGLDLAELEAADQVSLGLGRTGALLDQLDDLVDILQRLEQALQDVDAGLGLVELEDAAPGDDLLAEVQKGAEHLLETHGLWGAVVNG
ncbi:MAG: hypothetical protein BWY87_00534 [Deltaproteobacteria bacterium ADurb.Bin510]|nr:MAG: hypothetical protein BWY87_00534 [Deltaproteobacteria bacterium ADurb.Bin510]